MAALSRSGRIRERDLRLFKPSQGWAYEAEPQFVDNRQENLNDSTGEVALVAVEMNAPAFLTLGGESNDIGIFPSRPRRL